MLIDWFTVGAQILNFLVLVWLLKRYLYKPILSTIEEREKRIASQLDKAETAKREAQEEREVFQRKSDELERQREAFLSSAQNAANVEKQKLLTEARKDFETLRMKQQETLKSERANLNRELLRRTQSEVFAITRKTLADLASQQLEESIVDVFISRLSRLQPAEKQKLISPLPMLVRSTFDLTQTQRTRIEQTLKTLLAKEQTGELHFEIAPELVSGIELSANGNKVAWSITDYLSSLERSVAEAINVDSVPEASLNGEDDKHA